MFSFMRKKAVVEQQQADRKVSFRMQVPATVRREGNTFYSACDILDVHSQGTSEKEALDNLVEALQLFIETCFQQGTLGQVLREQGFEPSDTEQGFPGERTVEVPLALIARQHAAAHAH